MAAEGRGTGEVNSVKKSLSDDAKLAAFVEQQLDEALRNLPMIWRIGDTGLEIQRVVGAGGRWAWRRNEQLEWTWFIYSSDPTATPGTVTDSALLYYDLRASRGIEAFVLTHSNINAGLWSQRWLIKKATLIPFTALTIEHSIYSDGALSLAQLVADICLSCEPNVDWPT